MLSLDANRRRLLSAVGVSAAGLVGLASIGALAGGASRPLLRALAGPRPWLNTQPLSAEGLAGKVVLVNFWTYTCINSLRPLPYLRAWAQKYRDRGLVVVGAHTPEFSFEHDLGNARRAVDVLGVSYPVVLDNDYAIWSAFANNAWPGFYFIDANGRLRDRVLGEGNYDDSERLIQRLLSETGAPASDAIVDVPGEGAQAAPNWTTLRSPETYVGYAKASGFASRTDLRENAPAQYEHPASLRLNQWSLNGGWTAGEEFAATTAPGAAIQICFHARDLHLVLARGEPSQPIRFRLTIDGQPPGDDRGVDIDASGEGVLGEPRMYQLVRQRRVILDRTVEITFSAPGARAFVFTFG